MLEQTPQAVPWEIIGPIGGSLLLTIGLFLRHMTESRKSEEAQRKESHETIRKAQETSIVIAEKFSQTVDSNTSTFASTIKETLAQAQAAHEMIEARCEAARVKSEEAIRGLLRDAPRAHAREKGAVEG